jgi:hypothetical protein
MPRKSKVPVINSVSYTYVGNDKDFNLFLKSVIHDYIAEDKVSVNQKTDFVQKIESKTA